MYNVGWFEGDMTRTVHMYDVGQNTNIRVIVTRFMPFEYFFFYYSSKIELQGFRFF